MCCLSEASSHFVVFVCVNPDRKPSRKMKRRPSTSSGTELRFRRFDFEPRTHEPCVPTFDFSRLGDLTILRFNDLTLRSNK